MSRDLSRSQRKVLRWICNLTAWTVLHPKASNRLLCIAIFTGYVTIAVVAAPQPGWFIPLVVLTLGLSWIAGLRTMFEVTFRGQMKDVAKNTEFADLDPDLLRMDFADHMRRAGTMSDRDLDG